MSFHRGDELEMSQFMDIAEIADLCNVSPAAVTNWRKRFSDFPQPLAVLKSGPVFKKEEIKEALNKSPRPFRRQIFRSASLKNLEIHKVFLRFFASRCMKICSPIRAR